MYTCEHILRKGHLVEKDISRQGHLKKGYLGKKSGKIHLEKKKLPGE